MFTWPLMNNNITNDDKQNLVDFIMKPNVRFTNGEMVKKFEQTWSEWQGIKYSVFVNSGASANYIMTSILKEIKGVGEVIVAPLGWVSDVAPLVNLGFTPVFVDVDPNNFCITAENIKKAITPNTKGVVFVHALGFNGITDELLQVIKDNNLFFIEDCCESHGATFRNIKVGNFGDISNFSFYFGHHITTIEGGMICTNNHKLYEMAKLFRSHGMIREVSLESQQVYKDKYPDLNPMFIFAVPGYNMRSTEINAVLGLSQIKRIDENIKNRIFNLNVWLSNLDSNKYHTEYTTIGNSNFCLPLVLKNKDKNLLNKICSVLEQELVEYRIGTAGGGNQARQPYLKDNKYTFKIIDSMLHTDHIHDYGLYIGNNNDITEQMIIELTTKLNNVVM
jgi:CDP-6-deoxy-D-xylo-4-hexulose-3-dehydrase